MKPKNTDKKKILKELVQSNIENKHSSKRKKRQKTAGNYNIITDTLNIEGYFILFFLIILISFFIYNTNILRKKDIAESHRSMILHGIEDSKHRQWTIHDLFRLGVSTIIIDPGHGGRDPGTISPSGLQEKDIVLDISLKLRDILLRETPFNIVLTRERDESVSLSRRAAIANASNGDLFISIHLNYSHYTWFSGIETYVLGITDDTDALRTASIENLAENLTVSEMNSILEKIKKDIISRESLRFAEFLQSNVVKKLRKYNDRLKDIGVKKAPFIVLAKVDMPGVLIEVAFLSSRRDEELLRDPEYLESIAGGIYSGIIEYLENID